MFLKGARLCKRLDPVTNSVLMKLSPTTPACLHFYLLLLTICRTTKLLSARYHLHQGTYIYKALCPQNGSFFGHWAF